MSQYQRALTLHICVLFKGICWYFAKYQQNTNKLFGCQQTALDGDGMKLGTKCPFSTKHTQKNPLSRAFWTVSDCKKQPVILRLVPEEGSYRDFKLLIYIKNIFTLFQNTNKNTNKTQSHIICICINQPILSALTAPLLVRSQFSPRHRQGQADIQTSLRSA